MNITTRERKTGLSCAECRRSKLKCDRVFPCQSCIRRGCANICPDGALSATKGNKVLMARADKLSQQVKSMSSRIRQLEAALAESQAAQGGSHPLLDKPVKGEEADEDILLSEPESDDETGDETQTTEREVSAIDANNLGLPVEIISLAAAFPIGVTDSPVRKSIFLSFVPSRKRAVELSEIYHEYCAWMYQPVTGVDIQAIIDDIYDAADQPSLEKTHPHALSVFFMLMCLGSCYDLQKPSAQMLAEQYHALARAALSHISVVNFRSCATVQALLLLNVYKFISPLPSTEWRWLMSGITARVAQALGLQRECPNAMASMSTEEIQRRRVVFWELFVFESWTGLLGGRPPAFNLRHTSSRFPEDRDAVEVNGELEISFHSWKYRFAVGCMTLAAQHVFSTRPPSYESLLELDAKLRKFPIPSHLRTPTEEPPTPWSDRPHDAMQQYIVYIMLEGTILYLHRSYVAQMSAARETVRTFSRSLWAVYRSAIRIISGLRSLHQRHSEMTSRMFYFWSAYYSACMAIGSLIIEQPECKFAIMGLSDLEQAVIFYIEGSKSHIPSTKAWGILEKLLNRAREAVAKQRASGTYDVDDDPNDIDPDFESFRDIADRYDHTATGSPFGTTQPSSGSSPNSVSSPPLDNATVATPRPTPAHPTAGPSDAPPAAEAASAYLPYGQFVPPDIDNAYAPPPQQQNGYSTSFSPQAPHAHVQHQHLQSAPAIFYGGQMMLPLAGAQEWTSQQAQQQQYQAMQLPGMAEQQMNNYARDPMAGGPRAEVWGQYLSQHLGFPYVGWG